MAKSKKDKVEHLAVDIPSGTEGTFVLFGHDVDDDEKTGYLSAKLDVTEDRAEAKVFEFVKGDGKLEGWTNMVNEDIRMNHGMHFHPIVCYKKKRPQS